MTDPELRRAKRYRLVAPADFWWPALDGSTLTAHGVTRDMSNIGVMITSDECPPVGAHIQVTVHIPRRHDSRYQLELHGEGTVVRVEQATEARRDECARGFAASVQFYPEPLSGTEELGRDRSAV